MLRRVVTTFICFLCLFVSTGCEKKVPQYALLEGGAIQFPNLHGKLVLINYWATWCKPCRQEIPELNRFARENRGRVAVFGVNYDRVTGDVLKQQVTTMGITFATLLDDPRPLFSVKASGVLPETLVLDENGKYVTTLVGPQTYENLEKLLNGTSTPPQQ